MKRTRQLFVLFLFVALIIGAWTYWAWKIWPGRSLEQEGQFGDSFGALNTLFTGLAFAGLAFTIYLQLSEGRLNEYERYEERFESRFFRVNDALRSVVAGIVVRDPHAPHGGKMKIGKDAFGALLVEMSKFPLNPAEYPLGSLTPIDEIRVRYQMMYSSNEDDLGPYFRMLYQIIRYIQRSVVKNKQEYADVIRAELSSSELCLLAINCLTAQGENFKPLVEEFGLLKHMPANNKYAPKSVVAPAFTEAAFAK